MDKSQRKKHELIRIYKMLKRHGFEFYNLKNGVHHVEKVFDIKEEIQHLALPEIIMKLMGIYVSIKLHTYDNIVIVTTTDNKHMRFMSIYHKLTLQEYKIGKASSNRFCEKDAEELFFIAYEAAHK